jgi:acylphosphatase
MTERLEATIHGYVQGVGFRWFVVKRATQLALTGWTSNERDGTVRVVAEGAAHNLDELLQLLHEGPAGAYVERVDAVRMPSVGGFRGFSIRSGGHRGD